MRDRAISSYVEVQHDDRNPARPNLYRVLSLTPLDAQLRARFESGGERKLLYPLVFPTMLQVPALLRSLAPGVLEAARSGRAVILLDDTCEGPPMPPEMMAAIHDSARELGLPLEVLAIANHNLDYRLWYEIWAREAGERPGIAILYCHSWLIGASDTVSGLSFDGAGWIAPRFHDRAAFDVHAETALRAWEATAPAERRRYLMMNFKMRPHRVLWILRLIDAGLLAQGDVSFAGLEEGGGVKVSPTHLAEVEGFPQWRSLGPRLPELKALGALRLRTEGDPGDGSSLLLNFAEAAHQTTAFSVVSETDFTARGMRRVTEKSLKPLLNLHPFMTLGLPNTLSLLGSLGFRSFEGVIDETYDRVADFPLRFERLFREFERLCAMPDEEMAALRRETAEVRLHNAEHFVYGLPSVLREGMIQDTLERLEALTRMA